MEPTQPTQPVQATPATTTVSPGIFGTRIPVNVAFIVAVLLFFMPFVDIKCNNMTLQTVSGVQLATGFRINDSKKNDLFSNTGSEDSSVKTKQTADKKDPNLFALVAAGLGILGIILSFVKSRQALTGAMVTGIASAAALIGLWIDVKNKVKVDIPENNKGEVSSDISRIGKSLTDNVNISVDFTAWFYISLLVFLAAAFFCYKRVQIEKKPG